MQSRYYNPEWGRFINADAFVSTGQGFVGNNMYAYCLNNPVLLYDPSGAVARISNQFHLAQDDGCGGGGNSSADDMLFPFTASMGINFGFGIGPLTVGGQISVVTDAKGNSELHISYSMPTIFSTSLPSVDEMLADLASDNPQFRFGGYLAGNITFTNATSVDKLYGPANSVGASVSGLALDCLFFQDSDDMNKTYGGFSISSGAITPGFNFSMSNTVSICSLPFSVFDLVESAYQGIWRE